MCEAQIVFQKKVQSTIQELSRKHILYACKTQKDSVWIWYKTLKCLIIMWDKYMLYISCHQKIFFQLLGKLLKLYLNLNLCWFIVMHFYKYPVSWWTGQHCNCTSELYFLDLVFTWWTFQQSGPDWGPTAVLRTTMKMWEDMLRTSRVSLYFWSA